MKLPKVRNAEKYVSLYVVDFDDHCGVGFTADEVAELLESEQFKDVKVYKIYKALPNGQMELKGVPAETFQLEMGMFFYSNDVETAKEEYKRLVQAAAATTPPGRAKVHLSRYDDNKYVIAMIYPAEFNEEFSDWLKDVDYRTRGPAEGGVEAAERYYKSECEILQRHQFFAEEAIKSRSGEQLLLAAKMAMQR